jgi:signal transduction histidine kinase
MFLLKLLSANKYAILSMSVLFLGLVLSVLGSKFLFEYARQQQQLLIERNAEAHSEQLQVSITSAINTLSSISAFFKAQENIDQDHFSKFVKSDAAVKTGILALAWVPRITHEYRKQFEFIINKHLRGYKSITEFNGHGLILPARIRNDYFPVQHLYTNFDTELFIGLNLTAQASMRDNIGAAIAAGKLFATQAHHPSLHNPDRNTFQAYYPVYHSDKTSEFIDEDLVGFAMGLFDIEKLVENTFENTDSVNLLLFDVDSKKTNQLIYKSKTAYMDTFKLNNIHDLSTLTIPYWTRYFDVGNRSWLGVFISGNMNEGNSKTWLPYIGLFSGLLITSLLAIYLFTALLRGKQIHNLKYQLDDSEQLLTSQKSALKIQSQLSRKFESESFEKTRFMHALGHDLRQPLSTLGLYLEQIKLDKEDNNKRVLGKTKLTLKSLNHMFESMLEMTRLEAGIIQPKKMDIDLRILFQSLEEEFELPLKNKELSFHTRCNDYNIYSDPVLLEIILRNLITNAIKFTDKGKILLASRSLNNKTIIYVMDTGQGIDENKMDDVFKPYTRGDGITNDIGLGLGLAIVIHTIDLLGYELEISSKLDYGTCFRVIIDKKVIE